MRVRITLLLFSTVFFFVYFVCFVGDSLTSMAIDKQLICPRCRTPLEQVRTPKGSFWACQKCNGRAISVELLRRIFTPGSINPLWLHAISGTGHSGRLCPVCDKPMLEVKLADDAEVNVDVCRACHFVWFDAGETETLVPKKPVPPSEPMPQKAREAVALLKVEQLAKEAERREFNSGGLFWYDIADILGRLVLSAFTR